tara:strand:+ start:122 stop:445 length:324 start_codon:yes stop_codon:yes gene_type:complete
MGITEITIKHQLPYLPQTILDDLNGALNYAGYQTDSTDKYVLQFSRTILESNVNLTLEIVLGPEQDGPQTPFWITFYYQIQSQELLNTERYKKLLESEVNHIIRTIK